MTKYQIQVASAAQQLSLWGNPEPVVVERKFSEDVLKSLMPDESTESSEAYERRRCVEMAEKLCWPSVMLGPVRHWPGVTIQEGQSAWHTFLEKSSEGTIGLVMLALHNRINPCRIEEFDGESGLMKRPVEIISRVEERTREYMMRLAEALEWPRVDYWETNSRKRTIGPGQAEWRRYLEYGCSGLIADVVGVLERKLRGEPEKGKRAPHLRDDDVD